MAKQRNNDMMFGTSGRVGSMLVYRQREGKTIVSRRAELDPARTFTPAQLLVRDRFRNAIHYAKLMMENDELKAAYERIAGPRQTAFNMAVKDFKVAPEVRLINEDRLTGQIGDQLVIWARDVLMVKEVAVEILSSDSSLLEQGDAQMSDEQGLEWHYALGLEIVAQEDYIIRFRVRDTPGNVYSFEQNVRRELNS